MHFILTYTHQCKDYCARQFFESISKLPKGEYVLCLVDNTANTHEYLYKLEQYCKEYEIEDAMIHHLELPQFEEFKHNFLSNVCESANFGRDIFLYAHEKKPEAFSHMITIESDVMVPANLLELYEEILVEVPEIGICGGLYYSGMHEALDCPDNNELDLTATNIFSGCTLYSAELLKQVPFRWELDDLRIFPDSWINLDAREKGFKTANYNKIKCRHLQGGW